MNTISHLFLNILSLECWCWSVKNDICHCLANEIFSLGASSQPSWTENVLVGVCRPVSGPVLQPATLQPHVQTLRLDDQDEDERVLQFSPHGGSPPPAERGRVGGEEAVSRLVPGQQARDGEVPACPPEQHRGSGETRLADWWALSINHWIVVDPTEGTSRRERCRLQ